MLELEKDFELKVLFKNRDNKIYLEKKVSF